MNSPVCCTDFKEEARRGKRVSISIWYIWKERQVPRSEEENSRLSLGASISDLENCEYLNLSRSVVQLMKSVSSQTLPKGYPYITSAGCDAWQK